MINTPEDGAIVYCEGAFNTPNGKTAHGLVRFSNRYQVLAVIDSKYAGQDAGKVLDGVNNNIPLFETLEEAWQNLQKSDITPTHFVIGLAPDGGKLSNKAWIAIKKAIKLGLHVDSGLHNFLSEDTELAQLATENKVVIMDVRKPPPIKSLHFFSGKIEQVKSLKVAVLGTDSAIGKRTTALILVKALREQAFSAELIGTGQTAWMQGVKYGVIMDSLINDFVTGEIEHAVWKAWKETKAEVLVIEGQGSLMNPAYPGGFEILAAARPDVIILQHAPARRDYDGFPGYPIQPLPKQIEALQIISGKPVIAITLNNENINPEDIKIYTDAIKKTIGLPVYDVLTDGGHHLAKLVSEQIIKD